MYGEANNNPLNRVKSRNCWISIFAINRLTPLGMLQSMGENALDEVYDNASGTFGNPFFHYHTQ